MKRLIGNLCVVVLIVTFAFSCDDDEKKLESEPVFKLKDNSLSYSLEGSNLLLMQSGVEGDFNYFNYMITDGEHIEGESGHELNDYTNATYLIIVSLGARESFSAANYIQSNSWGSESGDFYSYLYVGTTQEQSLFTGSGHSNPIKISGGFGDGETMKIKFTGELMYSYYDQSTEKVVNTTADVVLFFEGTVDDRRQFD